MAVGSGANGKCWRGKAVGPGGKEVVALFPWEPRQGTRHGTHSRPGRSCWNVGPRGRYTGRAHRSRLTGVSGSHVGGKKKTWGRPLRGQARASEARAARAASEALRGGDAGRSTRLGSAVFHVIRPWIWRDKLRIPVASQTWWMQRNAVTYVIAYHLSFCIH
jgi:hypothetical protein